MRQRYFTGWMAIGAVVCFLGAGCGSKEEAQKSNPPPVNVAAQIQEIQNNPHMPPQAKAAAIATIQSQTATLAARAQKK